MGWWVQIRTGHTVRFEFAAAPTSAQLCIRCCVCADGKLTDAHKAQAKELVLGLEQTLEGEWPALLCAVLCFGVVRSCDVM